MPGTANYLKDKLKSAIDAEGNVLDLKVVTEVVRDLEKTDITAEDLTMTRLGRIVNSARRKMPDKSLAKRMKKLVKQWQRLAAGLNGTVDQERVRSGTPSPAKPLTTKKTIESQPLKMAGVFPETQRINNTASPPTVSTTPVSISLDPISNSNSLTNCLAPPTVPRHPLEQSAPTNLQTSQLNGQNNNNNLVISLPLNRITKKHKERQRQKQRQQNDSRRADKEQRTISPPLTSLIVKYPLRFLKSPPSEQALVTPPALQNLITPPPPSLSREQTLIMPPSRGPWEQDLVTPPSVLQTLITPPPALPREQSVATPPVLQSEQTLIAPPSQLPCEQDLVTPLNYTKLSFERIVVTPPSPPTRLIVSFKLSLLKDTFPIKHNSFVPNCILPSASRIIIAKEENSNTQHADELLEPHPYPIGSSVGKVIHGAAPSGRLKGEIPSDCDPTIDGCIGSDGGWHTWEDHIPSSGESVTVLPYVYIDGLSGYDHAQTWSSLDTEELANCL